MIYKSKRYLDLFISTIIVFFTLPIIIFFSILIILVDNQHPFFIQERSGIDGKKIFIYKLQTISYKKNSQSISNLGKFLRYTKIDELPQFINIIKNDLSLIGPRPLYIEYNTFLSEMKNNYDFVAVFRTHIASILERILTSGTNIDLLEVGKENYEGEESPNRAQYTRAGWITLHKKIKDASSFPILKNGKEQDIYDLIFDELDQ